MEPPVALHEFGGALLDDGLEMGVEIFQITIRVLQLLGVHLPGLHGIDQSLALDAQHAGHLVEGSRYLPDLVLRYQWNLLSQGTALQLGDRLPQHDGRFQDEPAEEDVQHERDDSEG